MTFEEWLTTQQEGDPPPFTMDGLVEMYRRAYLAGAEEACNSAAKLAVEIGCETNGCDRHVSSAIRAMPPDESKTEKPKRLNDAELMALAALHFGTSIQMQGDNMDRANQGYAAAWTSGCEDEYGDILYRELTARGIFDEESGS